MKLVKNHDQNLSYEILLGKWKEVLDNKAPIKSQCSRSNHGLFMNKNITKAITDPTRLRTKFSKSRPVESRANKEIIVFPLFEKLKEDTTLIWIIRRLLVISLLETCKTTFHGKNP